MGGGSTFFIKYGLIIEYIWIFLLFWSGFTKFSSQNFLPCSRFGGGVHWVPAFWGGSRWDRPKMGGVSIRRPKGAKLVHPPPFGCFWHLPLVGLVRSRSTRLSLRYLWIQVSKLSSSSKESNPESDVNPLYYRTLSFNSWLCRVTAYMVNNLNIQELTEHSYKIDKCNIQQAIDIQKFSDIHQSQRLQNPVTKSKKIQA